MRVRCTNQQIVDAITVHIARGTDCAPRSCSNWCPVDSKASNSVEVGELKDTRFRIGTRLCPARTLQFSNDVAIRWHFSEAIHPGLISSARRRVVANSQRTGFINIKLTVVVDVEVDRPAFKSGLPFVSHSIAVVVAVLGSLNVTEVAFERSDISGGCTVIVSIDWSDDVSLVHGRRDAVVSGVDGGAARKKSVGKREAAVVFKVTQNRIDWRAGIPGLISICAVRKPGRCSEVADEIVAVGREAARRVRVRAGCCVVSDDGVLKLSVCSATDTAALVGRNVIGH